MKKQYNGNVKQYKINLVVQLTYQKNFVLIIIKILHLIDHYVHITVFSKLL